MKNLLASFRDIHPPELVASLRIHAQTQTQLDEIIVSQRKTQESIDRLIGIVESNQKANDSRWGNAEFQLFRCNELAFQACKAIGDVHDFCMREATAHRDRIDELESNATRQIQDAVMLLLAGAPQFKSPSVILESDHKVAADSVDHIRPRGTRNDDTRHPRFIRRCEETFGRALTVLDLGCAGGGLVFDFLLRDHFAIGLEGSDYSMRAQRAHWRLLPRHLLTCDITKPFGLRHAVTHEPVKFDVISAWEVLEHIPIELLPGLLQNIRSHMSHDGIFAASIATFDDVDPTTQVNYHATVKPRDWWESIFRKYGFEIVNGLFEPLDFPRGSGNGPRDWSVLANPELGFHLVAKLQ